ncbi:hypothetical protein HMPREF1314_1392 [Bifidobacterium longum subsp. longum 35B]|nr:hypothetical protein HMPREF1314_1392 [Bifidobacterium longum subsp. longum 35B]
MPITTKRLHDHFTHFNKIGINAWHIYFIHRMSNRNERNT